jgi:mannose-6-phosphate isomerase
MMRRIQEPLRFERIFLEKVWGGRALEAPPEAGGLGLILPDEMQVGETWELVDRSDANSVVATGTFTGARLEELMSDAAGELLGDVPATSEGRFPLLVKYIDAAAHLSVQVHPDDRLAAAHTGWEAKTEAWVILGSTEAGRIYHGFAPGVERADFERAVRAGAPIEAMLRSHRPAPGECFFVPGGTVHAIGAGVTLIEVQQNSDTTFRVDDWGRVGLDGKPRELHVDEALACLDFGPAPAPVAAPNTCPEPTELATCAAFSMGLVEVMGSLAGTTQTSGHGAPHVVAAVCGSGELHFAGGRLALSLGDVVLLPAALGDYRIQTTSAAPLRLIDMRGPSPASLPA